MNYNARKIASILLGLTSAVGTVACAVLVAKETPKALDKINELKNEKNTKKIEYIKPILKYYWPAIVVGFGSIASSTISNIISIKTEASLIATTTMLSQGIKKYRNKVEEYFGIDTRKFLDSEIEKDNFKKKENVALEDDLYWEEHLGFFRCKPVNLMAALSDLNQRLHTPDPDPNGTFYFTTLSILMEDAQATVIDKNKLKISEHIGWTTDYLCDEYSLKNMWVHPEYTHVINEKTGEYLFTKISFFEDPIYLEDSEISRNNYKSRECYKHNENTLFIRNYPSDNLIEDCNSRIDDIQESFICQKEDCEKKDDDRLRFNPTKPRFITIIDINQLDDKNAPKLEDIPKEDISNENISK